MNQSIKKSVVVKRSAKMLVSPIIYPYAHAWRTTKDSIDRTKDLYKSLSVSKRQIDKFWFQNKNYEEWLVEDDEQRGRSCWDEYQQLVQSTRYFAFLGFAGLLLCAHGFGIDLLHLLLKGHASPSIASNLAEGFIGFSLFFFMRQLKQKSRRDIKKVFEYFHDNKGKILKISDRVMLKKRRNLALTKNINLIFMFFIFGTITFLLARGDVLFAIFWSSALSLTLSVSLRCSIRISQIESRQLFSVKQMFKRYGWLYLLTPSKLDYSYVADQS